MYMYLYGYITYIQLYLCFFVYLCFFAVCVCVWCVCVFVLWCVCVRVCVSPAGGQSPGVVGTQRASGIWPSGSAADAGPRHRVSEPPADQTKTSGHRGEEDCGYLF